MTPTPSQSLVIYCDSNFPAEAHIDYRIRNSQDLLRERTVSPNAAAPEVQLSLLRDASGIKVGLNLHNVDIFQPVDQYRRRSLFKLRANPQLEISIASTSEHLTIFREEERMILPGAYGGDVDAIECCHFEWSVGLRALFGIEAALTLMVVSTADDIFFTGQEQSVRPATTKLDDLLIQDIKCFQSQR